MNGDGMLDLVIDTNAFPSLSSAPRHLEAWFMNGASRVGSNTIKDASTQQILALPANLSPVGGGDIQREGKTDLLFVDRSTGELQTWFMNGTDRTSQQFITDSASGAHLMVGTGWFFGAVADLNRDGMPDLAVFYASTGEIQAWFMQGTDRTAFASVKDHQTQAVISAPGWELIAASDFDLDGDVDLIVRNDGSGVTQVWYMQGTDRLAAHSIADACTGETLIAGGAWVLRLAGDVNRDGYSDLIWQNTDDGEIQVWYMNGADRVDYELARDGTTHELLAVKFPATITPDQVLHSE